MALPLSIEVLALTTDHCLDDPVELAVRISRLLVLRDAECFIENFWCRAFKCFPRTPYHIDHPQTITGDSDHMQSIASQVA
jgi:hypothetical protein